RPADCGIPEAAAERGHERRLLATRRKSERDEDQHSVVDVEATQRAFARDGSHRRQSLAHRGGLALSSAQAFAATQLLADDQSHECWPREQERHVALDRATEGPAKGACALRLTPGSDRRERVRGGLLAVGEYALQNRHVQLLLGAGEAVGCTPRQPSRIAD